VDVTAWVVAGLAALVIGISKTSVATLAGIAVAAFTFIMPTAQSTAAILLILIVGDIVAVIRFRHDVDWKLLWRLIPFVIPGLLIGTIFMGLVSDVVLRKTIGVILLLPVLWMMYTQWRASKTESTPVIEPDGKDIQPNESPAHRWLASIGYGAGAGFATMTANSGGPVMTMYLLNAKVDKLTFVGTGAWFYFLINLTKVPFSAFQGLIHPSTLWMDLKLAPFVLIGTVIGAILLNRVNQLWFNRAALFFSAVSALILLIH
jgi:uncharacterized membrane protein YfcA